MQHDWSLPGRGFAMDSTLSDQQSTHVILYRREGEGQGVQRLARRSGPSRVSFAIAIDPSVTGSLAGERLAPLPGPTTNETVLLFIGVSREAPMTTRLPARVAH